eukprot:gene26101-31518_t
MNDILNVLPKLARGLDVNIKFNGVNKYEFTEEISIFDILDIPLVHGWLYDASDADLSKHIGDLSYNHLQFKLVDYRSVLDKLDSNEQLDSNEEALLQQGRVIDQFLARSASQLTTEGLHALYSFLADQTLAVFFRNNHFSTLFAHQGQLFLLLTDLGFLHTPTIVWEVLHSVDGKTDFCDSEFFPSETLTETPIDSAREDYVGGTYNIVTPANAIEGGTVCLPPGAQEGVPVGKPPYHASPRVEEMDPSLLLALQLQEEEFDQYPPIIPINHPAPTTVAPAKPSALEETFSPLSQPTPAPTAISPTVTLPVAATPAPREVVGEGINADVFDGMSSQERDEQIALYLHYQQQREGGEAASPRPRTTPSQSPRQGSGRSPRAEGARSGGSRGVGQQTSKSSGACVVS